MGRLRNVDYQMYFSVCNEAKGYGFDISALCATCAHRLKFELIVEVNNELVCISSGIYKLGCVD